LILKDWIKLVETFEGIIGAVAGVVFTLIITHILKNLGQVTSNLYDVKPQFYNHHILSGNTGPVKSLEEADHATISFTIDFFNNSESHKAINNLSITLLDTIKNNLQTITPSDLNAKQPTNYGTMTYEEIDHFNIGPKELIKKELSFSFHSENISILKECKRIVFSYEVLQGKVNKIKKNEHLIEY
jgi:hypothetical protein